MQGINPTKQEKHLSFVKSINPNENRELDLSDHFVLENLFFVENLDGYIFAGNDVPGELNLGEIAFTQGPTQFVLPHARPAAIARPRRHIISLSELPHLAIPPLQNRTPSQTWFLSFFFSLQNPSTLSVSPSLESNFRSL